MNEADPSPINLDELRMLPDWLREDAPPPSKQYAEHNYPTGDDRGERRGGRSGGFGGGGDRRDARGGGGGPRRDGGGRSGPPPRGGGGPNRDRGPRGRDDRQQVPFQPSAPPAPAPVRIEFLPDDRCLASINKQIRATHLAYPLFGLARMFLQEPERHFVQFSVAPDAPAGTVLHQLGEDGPITLDPSILEKTAFDATKDQYYVEETVQKEPLKGNFTNVARERLSGTLLGPTNYHAYQPGLRSLYESRYSRRMSFEDFRRNVEVSTDPALIERWKEEARTTTTISTRVGEGETPAVLNSQTDVRTHFRQHHLAALLRSGTTLKVHGSVARKLPEPALMGAIRESHDREMRYPAQFVQLLRQGLQNCGLHIFKHRKRIVYVSLARPTPFVAQSAVSPNVTAILNTIAEMPLCTRKVLAERVLAKSTVSPEAPVPAAQTPIEAVQPGDEMVPMEASEAPSTEPSVSAAESENVDSEVSIASAAPTDAAATTAPEASEPPITAPADDPAARAKAGLAADLRFLVQSGHIIEFHNGTFDLPLPPKAKETNASTPAAKPTTPKPSKREESAAAATPAEPPASAKDTQAEPVLEYTATEHDAPESEHESAPSLEVTPPSMLEVKETAPTAAMISETTNDLDSTEISADDIVISPGQSEAQPEGGKIPDKSDDSGRISGAGAAPLDPPVPGDTEDRPTSQL